MYLLRRRQWLHDGLANTAVGALLPPYQLPSLAPSFSLSRYRVYQLRSRANDEHTHTLETVEAITVRCDTCSVGLVLGPLR